MGYFGHAGSFLIDTLIGLYILAVLLRLLFQIVRADFYNPISQFLVRVTNPLVLPLRRVIPGFAGIDWASVILVVVLQLVKLYLLLLIGGIAAHPAGVVVLAFAQLLQLTVYVFLVAILIRVILSWVNPYGDNPVNDLLISVTEPLMRPARQIIPPIGGLDLSPIAVLILLQLTLMLIVQPLMDVGQSLAL
jgi:YggT family protein